MLLLETLLCFLAWSYRMVTQHTQQKGGAKFCQSPISSNTLMFYKYGGGNCELYASNSRSIQ